MFGLRSLELWCREVDGDRMSSAPFSIVMTRGVSRE